MKKLLITLLIFILFVSGCTIKKISDKSVSDLFDTVLFVDNNLSNTYLDGYSLYLPHGVSIVDKDDFNLKIIDNSNSYYLYIDTIAYYYKVHNSYVENNSHFYSKKINHNGISGFIDILDENDRYFVVIMYNYAKIEAYIKKEDFNKCLMNMSSILSTVKYNDKVISDYVGHKGSVFQEEKFNIFEANIENDNFLRYEEEYGTYDKEIVIDKDRDIIDVDEVVE